MIKWMGKYVFNRKWICRYVLVLFILSLIPLMLIAYYNHPCADDFSYGNHTIATWRGTGSIVQTITAAINGVKNVYYTWQGSFVAVYFMTLHPAIFAEHLYMLVPIILLLSLVAATMLLLKVVLMNYLGADKYSCVIISIMISFLSIQFAISPVEAFYWYNGAMYYTGFYALSLVLFSLVLLSMKTDKARASIIYAILALVISFMIGGSNFIAALTSSIIMALFFIFRLVIKRRKWLIPLLGLLAICASLFISASAPGNAIRQVHFQSMNPILAIVTSFSYAVRFVVYYIRMPVYFAFGCIASLVYKIARNSEFTFRLPGIATAILYGVYASTYTPNLYAMSSLGPARVANVNYYAFLLFLLFTIIYWCGWIARKISRASLHSKGKKKASKQEPSMEPGLISILAVCFIFGCVIVSSDNVNAMTSISAVKSLVTGEARTYHKEYLSRLSRYANPEISQVEVPSFTVNPYVLYFDDITSDPDDWRNTAIASYYGKESITLIE